MSGLPRLTYSRRVLHSPLAVFHVSACPSQHTDRDKPRP